MTSERAQANVRAAAWLAVLLGSWVAGCDGQAGGTAAFRPRASPPSHAASASTIDPGNLGPALSGTGCFEGGNCDFCETTCGGASENTARASVHTTALPSLRPFLRTAYSHVYTEFTVSAPRRGQGDWVTATVFYDIEWRGLWAIFGVLTGANKATMTLDLAIQDVAELSRILVVQPIHETDPDGFGVEVIEVGAWTDQGREQGSFTTQLRRGHTYRLTHRLNLKTVSYLNAYYALDYRTGDWGAWWNDLRVALGPDPVELVAELEGRLEQHAHEYLTGRGEGHNNTAATTSATVFLDGEGDAAGTHSGIGAAPPLPR